MKKALTQRKKKTSKKNLHMKTQRVRQQKKYQSEKSVPSHSQQISQFHKKQRSARPKSIVSQLSSNAKPLFSVENTVKIHQQPWLLPGIPHMNAKKNFRILNTISKKDASISVLNRIYQEKTSNIIRQTPSFNIKIKNRELSPIQQVQKEEREKLYKIIRNQFRQVINTSNSLHIRNQDQCFKAYIEKGNNGGLIKQILKRRWWWNTQQKDKSKANFIWTQWLSNSVTEKMQSVKCNHQPNQTVQYKQYTKEEESNRNNWIKKIVDDNTYQKIKSKISQKNINYFKTNLLANKNKNNQQQSIRQIMMKPQAIIHNHVQGCLNLHSKKLLFKNLSGYLQNQGLNPFKFIPLTFYIDKIDSQSYTDLLSQYDRIAEQLKLKNIWICKPGQNSNRGYGISVLKSKQDIVNEIKKRIGKNQQQNGYKHSLVLQKYIEDCFLINKRKFDIRCYILLTTVNGYLKGYWFQDGYIRTSSQQYSLEDISNLLIHLTNDAIQKKCATYGKYEDFNKVSFSWFKNYIRRHGHKDGTFELAYSKMKQIAHYLIASVSPKIKRKQYTFELFGLDFMLTSKMEPLLIEANSNPCLQTSGVILSNIIHQLVQNVMMTAVDPLFPQPANVKKGKDLVYKDYFASNKFELIYADKIFKEPSQKYNQQFY